MRRILIIGSGGSGKSTLARLLGARLELPVVHLDAHHWHPGWIGTPSDEWQSHVARLIAADRWIMDGNYGGTLDMRLAACDTVIFLDLPRYVCVWRVLKRVMQYRGRSRPDMSPGCPERVSFEFLSWVWNYPSQKRPGILRRLAALPASTRVIHLRSTREVAAYLNDNATRTTENR